MSQIVVIGGGNGGDAVLTLTGDSGGAVSPDSGGNINIVGGTNITVAGTPLTNTLTVNATASGMAWSTIGASGTLAVNHGYICTGGAALSFALPATSAVGDMIAITLDGSTSWTITQGVGQQIRIGTLESTSGVGGFIVSTDQGDTVTMVCSVADTRWNVISAFGNIGVT